jgi:putative oxidoreductase
VSARTLSLLRVALGAFFLAAGLAKLFALDIATTIVAEKGVPAPHMVALVVGAAEAFAGLVLLVNARTRAVAQTLIAGVVLAALVFHDPIGLGPGSASMTLVSLAIDASVVLGLTLLARATPPAQPIR